MKYLFNEVSRILEDSKGNLLKNLLRTKYQEEGHSDEWIDTLLQFIDITVSPAIKDTLALDNMTQECDASNKQGRDRTRFRLVEHGEWMPKRRFVLEVVRNYVKNNPKTYSEYDRILNSLRPDSMGVIRPLNLCDPVRYFTEESDVLKSTDGIVFAVCNQWGIDKIKSVVVFAKSQGYYVTEQTPDK